MAAHRKSSRTALPATWCHRDTIQLATSIEALLADPAHAKEMARAGGSAPRRVSLQCLCKSLKKSCANNANPDVTETYAPFLEFGGPPGRYARFPKAWPASHQVTVLTGRLDLESACRRRSENFTAERSPFGWRREENACSPFISYMVTIP